MLREILESLGYGGYIILSERPNELGELIAEEMLAFVTGSWVLETLNCSSSRDLGLGTCACYSHDPYREEVISREKALRTIRAFIEEKAEAETRREREIAWLKRAISELE